MKDQATYIPRSAGRGHRFVKVGEVLKSTDEVAMRTPGQKGRKWTPLGQLFSYSSQKVRYSKSGFGAFPHRFYRRKISP